MKIKFFIDKWKNFVNKWIKNPHNRYRLFTGLSFILTFFIPLFGWNPLLIVWAINSYYSYKETCNSMVRRFHVLLAFAFTLLIVHNLILRIWNYFSILDILFSNYIV